MSRHFLSAALLSLATAFPAVAQDVSDVAQVDILPGWRTESGAHMAALRIRLKPGWHTYWRAPGDAGVPPSFDFGGSRNVGGVAFHWPTPEVFWNNGMASVGYKDELILPMQVTPRQGGEGAHLSAVIDLGVCEEICIPMTVAVSADLPQDAATPDNRIRAALADRPLTADEAGAGRVRCEVAPARDGLRVITAVDLPSMGRGEFAVVEMADPGLWVSEARIGRDGDRLTAEVDVVPLSGGAVAFDRGGLRMTVLGARGAVELAGCS